MGAGNKGPGFETKKKHPTSSMKDERYIPPLLLSFVQGGTYIHLLLTKHVSDTVIRGYIKDRNLCVILDLEMTLRCVAIWIYQVLDVFITLINTNL
jgi:hypothetical protein